MDILFPERNVFHTEIGHHIISTRNIEQTISLAFVWLNLCGSFTSTYCSNIFSISKLTVVLFLSTKSKIQISIFQMKRSSAGSRGSYYRAHINKDMRYLNGIDIMLLSCRIVIRWISYLYRMISVHPLTPRLAFPYTGGP